MRADLARIRPLRERFLADAAFQVRYHAHHERGWTDSYVLTAGDTDIGYGSVKGRDIADRDTVFEFLVLPPFEGSASSLFGDLLTASGVTHIEAQTNDPLMAAMLFEFGHMSRQFLFPLPQAGFPGVSLLLPVLFFEVELALLFNQSLLSSRDLFENFVVQGSNGRHTFGGDHRLVLQLLQSSVSSFERRLQFADLLMELRILLAQFSQLLGSRRQLPRACC